MAKKAKKVAKKRIPRNKVDVKPIIINEPDVKDEDIVIVGGDNGSDCGDCGGTGLKNKESLCGRCGGSGQV